MRLLSEELIEIGVHELKEASGKDVMLLSGIAGTGLDEALRAIRRIINDRREQEEAETGRAYAP